MSTEQLRKCVICPACNNEFQATPEAVQIEIAALRAELEKAREDAELFEWLWPRLSGRHFREAGVIYSEGGEHGIKAAIRAAMSTDQAERKV